jgi:hypothetical protein
MRRRVVLLALTGLFVVGLATPVVASDDAPRGERADIPMKKQKNPG